MWAGLAAVRRAAGSGRLRGDRDDIRAAAAARRTASSRTTAATASAPPCTWTRIVLNYVAAAGAAGPSWCQARLAIEPMMTLGTPAPDVLEDDGPSSTVDGRWASHWEHTVALTAGRAAGAHGRRRRQRQLAELGSRRSRRAGLTVRLAGHCVDLRVGSVCFACPSWRVRVGSCSRPVAGMPAIGDRTAGRSGPARTCDEISVVEDHGSR